MVLGGKEGNFHKPMVFGFMIRNKYSRNYLAYNNRPAVFKSAIYLFNS